MQKIPFCDRYGLTNAVINQTKTKTRRISYDLDKLIEDYEQFYEEEFEIIIQTWDHRRQCIKISTPNTISCFKPRYKLGEVVAVAQSYKDLGYTKEWVEQHISPNPHANWNDPFEKKYPGWSNKMFVPAELNNAHKILITDIKIERLQDITDEDCMKEGIYRWKDMEDCPKSLSEIQRNRFGYYGVWDAFSTPRKAFADLIDKPGVGGKGTWERNPWVSAYTFELVK